MTVQREMQRLPAILRCVDTSVAERSELVGEDETGERIVIDDQNADRGEVVCFGATVGFVHGGPPASVRGVMQSARAPRTIGEGNARFAWRRKTCEKKDRGTPACEREPFAARTETDLTT
jgi:hypothetical protein